LTAFHSDVVVVGGGQAGLAVGYYLRRTGLSFEILDAQEEPGGAWLHGWDSLRLFSPARFSSLPGWMMPGGADRYPRRDEALDYLARYEERYRLPVRRPVRVHAVQRYRDVVRGDDSGSAQSSGPDEARFEAGDRSGDLLVRADAGTWRARAVVSATGSWQNPHIPEVAGRGGYRGVQLHSGEYRSPERFGGQRVLVVGGGNSGAQILAEVSRVADVTWVTLEPPTFLPDHVDGRYLFDQATAWYRAREAGLEAPAQASLGDIVMVEPVREARDRGVLGSVRLFERFTADGVVWSDGRKEAVDAVIWCTGFRPALDHLAPLGVIDSAERVDVVGTRSAAERRLWLVGYGNWTGFASATLIGVGRSARATVDEITRLLAPADGSRPD
jgi:putative flavoprotein involved in K+ transport